MGATRPRIGVNSTFEPDADGGRSMVRPQYWQAVGNAGGLPVLLPQYSQAELVNEALDGLTGFVMIGGYDIEGAAFGETTLPTVEPADPMRMQADELLIAALIDRKIPTLLICLGFQQANVLLGGTLIQDIAYDGPRAEIRHYSKAGDVPEHDITVEEGSRLAEALGGAGSHRVNSKHHQAVGVMGKGFVPVAHADDGIVEAAELAGHPFFLGVQWHAELMPAHAGLFQLLVKEANNSA